MTAKMKLHDELGVDLALFDAELERIVLEDPDMPDGSPIADGVLRLIRSGGKRVRPLLVFVGGRFGPRPQDEQLTRIAALMEFLHMASLVHDDIIDGAETRRGAPALHRVIGVSAAVHAANYMISRAVEWAGEGGVDAARSAELTSLAAQLVMGEYGQLRNRFAFDAMTLDAYLKKTREKTALLIASCLSAGAAAAEADRQTIDTLYAFGDALGMSFQIQDDILDFTATSVALGKPAGSDLRGGQITLPTLYALGLPGLGDDIRRLDEHSSEEAFRDAVQRIAASEAMDLAAALRDDFADRARSFAALLAGEPGHPQLLVLLRHFTHRGA